MNPIDTARAKLSKMRGGRVENAIDELQRIETERSRHEPRPRVEDLIPGPTLDGSPPEAPGTPDESGAPSLEGAWNIFRRGLRASPELRSGLAFTLGLAGLMTLGRILIPILIQQIFDKGITGASGFRPGFVYGAGGIAAALTILFYFAGRATYARLVRASELALKNLRVRTFAHIHDLSIAEQRAEKRGAFVSRVTADIDTLGQFMEWGGITWILSIALMLGTLIAMAVYSWQLTLVILVVVSPIYLVLRRMQKGLLAAYDRLRTRVGETLSEISESIMGAAVVRAYGLEDRMDRRVKDAIQRQYKAQMDGAKYMATIFPVADLFGAAATAAVLAVGAHWGPGWGLTFGDLVAFLFLVNLFLQPLAELSETFDMTQTAIAGWRKVLAVMDLPIEIVEPDPGRRLPPTALSIRTEDLRFAYADGGGMVLRGIDADIAAGAHIAIVGETGCGKTTFAKLLCRLADPTSGRILIDDVDLREVAPESRRAAIRMVPQDGTLFDTTIRENVRYGREGAADLEVVGAFEALGLGWWMRALPDGLDTRVGERGDALSVGERQLVALARAQLSQPGLLILDEATSAVDPETERAIGEALVRLSEGRTTVTIAHRLSTAEAADFVLVFDRGRVVERGRHEDLVSGAGVYASLYESWLGNTRVD